MALGPTFLLEVARYLGGGRGGTVDAVDAESGTTLTRQSLLASAPWWALGACTTLVDTPKKLWCDHKRRHKWQPRAAQGETCVHERQRTAKPGKPGKRCIAIRAEVWGLSINKGGWEVCGDQPCHLRGWPLLPREGAGQAWINGIKVLTRRPLTPPDRNS